MNTKLSGAQLVLVPITQVGRNYFPLVENIRKRLIKYIDFYAASYLPDVADPGLTSDTDMYVTIRNQYGNTDMIDHLPLERFNYSATQGIRQKIGAEISLTNCYVDCQDSNNVGKTAAFLFWYDLPEYSSKNTTLNLTTDAISIPLTTASRYNQLPDVERMAGKSFRRILCSTPSVTPNLKTGVTAAQLANLYITLRKGSYNIVENMPLAMLRQLTMLQPTVFQNIRFDFQSSYITIGGAGTIPNVNTDYIGKYVFLNLQYEN